KWPSPAARNSRCPFLRREGGGCETRRASVFRRSEYCDQMPQPELRTDSCFLSRHAWLAVDRGRKERLHFSIRSKPVVDRQCAEPESSGYLAGTGNQRYRGSRGVSESARRYAAR